MSIENPRVENGRNESFWTTPEGIKRVGETPCHYHDYHEYTAIYEDPYIRDEMQLTSENFSTSQIACILQILVERGISESSEMQSERDRSHIPHMEMFGYYDHDSRTFIVKDRFSIEFRERSDSFPRKEFFEQNVYINGELASDFTWPDA
jgi:hypothetical protein